ncbi:SirB1 family protein [Oceanibaculum pacificum]|uniref:Protein SirB1 N-terminal domain-containing protein n=1 Tax=Oceanibaculum pacificum TaxID=580166 RepID=A0A154WGZ7_9PROT|nr:transglutaminase-like domain-containing protein [Oceanibaculum pacificum]KZD12787.1 hypothetical protein AUP43_00140 [Oceanibaculum pacificum]
MDTKAQARAILAGLAGAGDSAVDIGGAALALAAFDRPRVGLERYQAHLAELGGSVDALAQGTQEVQGRAAVLAMVMAEQFRYQGDELTYDDLQNANLMRVIDRRRGLPVALGILYIHVARQQGWQAVGLNFPGHFLIRIETGGGRAILDPFSGGRMVSPADLRRLLTAVAGDDATLQPEHYEPVPDRAILLRLQNNIVMRRLRQGELEPAARALDSMLLFAPDRPALWREVALVQAKLENMKTAIAALERFVALTPSPTEKHEASALLQSWKSHLN